jgi:hypothetical protein
VTRKLTISYCITGISNHKSRAVHVMFAVNEVAFCKLFQVLQFSFSQFHSITVSYLPVIAAEVCSRLLSAGTSSQLYVLFQLNNKQLMPPFTDFLLCVCVLVL